MLFGLPIDNDVNYLLSELGNNIAINGVPSSAIINTLEKGDGRFQDQNIIVKDIIKRGDFITYNDMDFLIINEIINKRYNSYYKGVMRKTNQNIKIVVNGKVETIKTIVDDYLNTIRQTVHITLDESKLAISTQDNVITKGIKVGSRFIKFRQAWKVENIDYTETGLLTFKCIRDTINPNTDDIENEIANIDKVTATPPVVEEPTQPSQAEIDAKDLATITALLNNITLVGGETGTNITIPTITGDGVTTTWTSNNPTYLSNTGVVTRPSATTGNQLATLTVTLAKGTQSIAKDFVFTILAEELKLPDKFTLSITGSDTIKTGVNQTYTATVLNNGQPTTQTVTWILDNLDAPTVTLLSQDGTSCTLTKTKLGFGEAYLKAILDVDTTIWVEKIIVANNV